MLKLQLFRLYDLIYALNEAIDFLDFLSSNIVFQKILLQQTIAFNLLRTALASGSCSRIFALLSDILVLPYDSPVNNQIVVLTNDQCMEVISFPIHFRYLVEFVAQTDKHIELPPHNISDGTNLANDCDGVSDNVISLEDVKGIPNPQDNVVAGLQSNNNMQFPLKSVHVEAKLIDLAAEVVVFQEYVNEGSESIEAKYVFPLNDMAAVCGFEAFINGKHIVGEVKEKEQAHREYKEAISQGHGAYLMDEEKPDVFTVSVGNLPAGANVLIKITYVAELAFEEEMINFSIPGTVAPWRRDKVLEEVTQTDVKRVDILSGEESFSLQIAIEMPFKIRELKSPTHSLKVKKTDTRAVIGLEPDVGLGEGFQLLVSLAEIHVPRMWVEQNPDDSEDQACMLTFFPEFEDSSDNETDVILLIDSSNSTKSICDNMKKAALLAISRLPENCRFNVISFGTNYVQLFPKCHPKTESNISEARLFLGGIRANKGGTDLWRVLRKIHLLVDGKRSHPLNLFLFSDGHISEEILTRATIRKFAAKVRFFTFGFGTTANRHLLTKLAQSGAGAAEFLDPKLNSKWERKVNEQIRKAQQPALTSVTVTWQQQDNDAPAPIQVH